MYKLALLILMPFTLCATNIEQASFWNGRAETKRGGPLGYPRDYSIGFSEEEFADIQFIVLTLADKSLVSIAKERYALESAGDRIDHVHPLNFLLAVFTNEELKVGVRNIRGKGWVWSNFVGGIKQTLSTEAQINNVMPFLQDFTSKLEISVPVVLPAVRSKNWDLFIDQLIRYVPRKDDSGRYDM
ncbi:MAG: hypothetical protein S4CHLAM81_12860 [Chlamydiales bacterium]|nr:hypothetical protein [Chlamydiales bacterium]MCH9636061.1 hypothetical protein [Chlamydiales bacterium]